MGRDKQWTEERSPGGLYFVCKCRVWSLATRRWQERTPLTLNRGVLEEWVVFLLGSLAHTQTGVSLWYGLKRRCGSEPFVLLAVKQENAYADRPVLSVCSALCVFWLIDEALGGQMREAAGNQFEWACVCKRPWTAPTISLII